MSAKKERHLRATLNVYTFGIILIVYILQICLSYNSCPVMV